MLRLSPIAAQRSSTGIGDTGHLQRHADTQSNTFVRLLRRPSADTNSIYGAIRWYVAPQASSVHVQRSQNVRWYTCSSGCHQQVSQQQRPTELPCSSGCQLSLESPVTTTELYVLHATRGAHGAHGDLLAPPNVRCFTGPNRNPAS